MHSQVYYQYLSKLYIRYILSVGIAQLILNHILQYCDDFTLSSIDWTNAKYKKSYLPILRLYVIMTNLYLCTRLLIVSVIHKKLYRSTSHRVRRRQYYCTTSFPVVRQHKNECFQLQITRDDSIRTRCKDVRHKCREHAGYG